MELKVTLIPDSLDEEGQPVFSSIESAIVEDIQHKIKLGVDKAVERISAEHVTAAALAYSTKRVAEIIDDIAQKPIVLTSPYGEYKGVPTTLTEIIVEKVNKYLGSTVDHYGNLSYNGKSPVSAIIEKIATDVLTKQIVEQTKEIRNKLILQIAEKLAK